MNGRLAVIVSLLLGGCGVSPGTPVPSQVLTEDEASINILNFQSLSVEERFSKAIAAGDARFLGIYGYALFLAFLLPCWRIVLPEPSLPLREHTTASLARANCN